MPTDHAELKAGLGTGIIEALAKHLNAVVVVSAAAPGTAITISDAAAAATEAATAAA